MDSKSLEKKLSSVKESSEDIQSISRWCIQHRSHHHSIVQAWSRAIRKAKVGHRLTLFYVCNDVVQNAKRKKCPELVQFFGTAVKEAAPLVREDKIRKKIVRIFNIWEERGIYDSKLVSEFVNIVENIGTVNSTENDIVLSTFQLEQLVESVRNLVALERTSESLLADLQTQEHLLTEEEIKALRLSVKERGASREKLEEFEESVSGLEFYIDSLQNEIDERAGAVALLEQAEIFYETQRGEAKLVSTAYKNFYNQVKYLKKKLLEKLPNLPEELSPIPSPPLDAPSPQSDTIDIDNSPVTEKNHSNEEQVTFVNTEVNSFMDSEKTLSFVQNAKETLLSDTFSSSSYDTQLTDKKDSSKSPTYVRPSSKERTLEEEQQEFEMQIATFSKPAKSYMDAKPMNAKELLDTFGKSTSTPSPVTHTAPPCFQIPPTPPLPPEPPMMPHYPPIPPRHSSALPIPLPPSVPPPAIPPLPDAFPPPPLPPQPVRSQFPPPLPKPTPPFQPYGVVANSPTAVGGGVRGMWSDGWMPLPPPPPPPPPITVKEPPKMEPDWAHDHRSQFPEEGWNAYESHEEPLEEEDDCCDDINWGEPPGTEELQTFDQLQAAAAAEQGKTSFLIPPPPPPPQFSLPPKREDSPDRHSNLVNIKPIMTTNSPSESDYHRYDYRSLSESTSFLQDGLFNSGDTDMRVRKPDGKQNGDESGSDMDISEGEGSDYEKHKRHRRDRKDRSNTSDDSPHKPVSFSFSKAGKPLVPLADKSGGFGPDEDDGYRKRTLPMPPSYAKRQKLLEKDVLAEVPVSQSGAISNSSIIDSIDPDMIAKALGNIRSKKEIGIEKELVREPSISEALGMYYDSENDSDPEQHSKPEMKQSIDSNDNKMPIDDDSTTEKPSQEKPAVREEPTVESVETPAGENPQVFSQVIESFISDTRCNDSAQEAYPELPSSDESPEPPKLDYSEEASSLVEVTEQSYESVAPAQPITAMYSSPRQAPPTSYGPNNHSSGGSPWQGQQRPRGRFFDGRSPRQRGARNFPIRPPPSGPFHRGRGGFRGGRGFNSPMGPSRWHSRGSSRPQWW